MRSGDVVRTLLAGSALLLLAAHGDLSRAQTGPCPGGGIAQTNPSLSASLVPHPELTPDRVVQIQLEALCNNDADDLGFEIAFRFASPANKANTGPLPRFIEILKNGPYALMLDFVMARYDPVEIRDDVGRQSVTLSRNGTAVTYVFYLSRQSEGPCIGCWMTDAVTFIESP